MNFASKSLPRLSANADLILKECTTISHSHLQEEPWAEVRGCWCRGTGYVMSSQGELQQVVVAEW